MRNGLVVHALHDASGDTHGSLDGRPRQQGHQLLSAIACQHVTGTAQTFTGRLGHPAQAGVTFDVTIGVVVFLEEIDVHHHQRNGLTIELGVFPFGLQTAVKIHAIGDAKQSIGTRQQFQPLVDCFQFLSTLDNPCFEQLIDPGQIVILLGHDVIEAPQRTQQCRGRTIIRIHFGIVGRRRRKTLPDTLHLPRHRLILAQNMETQPGHQKLQDHAGRIIHRFACPPHGRDLLDKLPVRRNMTMNVAMIDPAFTHQPLFVGKVIHGVIGQFANEFRQGRIIVFFSTDKRCGKFIDHLNQLTMLFINRVDSGFKQMVPDKCFQRHKISTSCQPPSLAHIRGRLRIFPAKRRCNLNRTA